VFINGVQTKTITVSGIPRLYTLFQSGPSQNGVLLLKASRGIQAYDFTFG
jgi:hypothetical protein